MTDKRIPHGELAYGQDSRYRHAGELFTGWAESAYRDVKEEQEFRDGFRWGPARVFKGGRLIMESNFRMDLLHGVEREWSDEGKLCREATYEHGILLGEREWDDGVLTKDFRRPEGGPQLAEMRRLYGTPEEVEAEESAYRGGALST